MLSKIATVLGMEFNENCEASMRLLQRVQSKLPAGTQESHPAFTALVEHAQDLIEAEARAAFAALVNTVTAAPAVKELKIKSSPKGARIKVAAVNGVRFSFGPIWNESVRKAKGIAVVAANRTKLNHQALLFGISDVESMSAEDLCREIAVKL